MKTVPLTCPKCETENSYAVADIKAANGQVECTWCAHRFTVVRKAKPAADTPPPAPQAAPAADTDLRHAKIPLREKLARLKQHSEALAAQQSAQQAARQTADPAEPASASPAPQPRTAAADTASRPPSAAEPANAEPTPAPATEALDKTASAEPAPLADKKAEAPDIRTLLQRHAAIDNETGQPLPFRLYQEPAHPTAVRTDSAAAIEALLQRTSTQASPPATLPNIDSLLKTIQQNTPAAPGGHTQNIHIQAQSLVFNLVSGKDSAAPPPQSAGLLPAVIDQAAGGGLPLDPPPPASRPEHDFNWTLASLVALTVLIIQLFYYLLIMR
ncbi:MAG: hypothetical protein Q4A62_02055 [Eikenella sp.]|nr:hypothetical protein [Eikenella sp.]